LYLPAENILISVHPRLRHAVKLFFAAFPMPYLQLTSSFPAAEEQVHRYSVQLPFRE